MSQCTPGWSVPDSRARGVCSAAVPSNKRVDPSASRAVTWPGSYNGLPTGRTPIPPRGADAHSQQLACRLSHRPARTCHLQVLTASPEGPPWTRSCVLLELGWRVKAPCGTSWVDGGLWLEGTTPGPGSHCPGPRSPVTHSPLPAASPTQPAQGQGSSLVPLTDLSCDTWEMLGNGLRVNGGAQRGRPG